MKSTLSNVSSAIASLKKECGFRTLNRLLDLHKALVKDGGEYDLDCLSADDLAFDGIFSADEAEALLFVISDSGKTGQDVSHLDQILKFGKY